jgi:hypothetical protein
VAFAAWQRRPVVRLLRDAGIALLVIGVASRGLQLYWNQAHWHLRSGVPSYDLNTFLRAASDLLNGRSPYTFEGDATYAYPPLLASLVVPLHWLSLGWASVVWMVLALAAIGLSLYLLGVRDWRCYALAADYPFVKSAVILGTATPLLLLAVAIGWRWRRHVRWAAVTVGAGVALKLFLWPLLAWLALTRGRPAAAAAAACAFALALLPWAMIGFAGISTYPDLLRRLTDDEAVQSFSGVAVAVRLHVAKSAASALALVLTGAVLLGAFAAARDPRFSQREREKVALVLSLAAALAATPILWLHYLLVLLVPLALTSPRLSLLWLLPFAYAPDQSGAWAYGDVRKLGITLVVTAALITVCVMRDAGRGKPLVLGFVTGNGSRATEARAFALTSRHLQNAGRHLDHQRFIGRRGRLHAARRARPSKLSAGRWRVSQAIAKTRRRAGPGRR